MTDLIPNMVDYEDARKNFSLDVPEYFNFGFDVLDRWAEDHTKLALVSVAPDGETAQKHTYWDLKVLSLRSLQTMALALSTSPTTPPTSGLARCPPSLIV